MLADETLLTTGKTVQSTSNRMQDGLNAIAEWCRAGSVTFRGDKVLRFLGGGGGDSDPTSREVAQVSIRNAKKTGA